MNTGRKDRAYPRTTKKELAPIYIFAEQVCAGGKGGGGWFYPIGTEMAILEYRVSKFDVFNRKLILKNNNFNLYRDAGADPSGPWGTERLPGDLAHWWLGFSSVNTLTGEEIVQQGNRITSEAPFDLEIDYKKLPQPTDAGWDNKIYIYLFWGDPTLLLFMRSEADLEVVKHDYDEKI